MGLHENTVMMRSLIAILLLLPLSALAQTQVPNVFEDGTPATAAEVNENFQYVMENASGGCSATQQDNSVLIECADGTSGVIAGAGTVYVYPSGTLGQLPSGSYNSGEIVLKDANDITLGPSRDVSGYYDVMLFSDERELGYIQLKNNHETQSVDVRTRDDSYAWYQTPDCGGLIFSQSYLVQIGGDYFAPSPDHSIQYLLHKSRRYNGGLGECEAGEWLWQTKVTIPYTPAPEILNAAYPVRLEQLP